MTNLEMRAFGWKLKEEKSKTSQATDGEEKKEDNPPKKVLSFLQFKRIAPYSRNFFFLLMESLMNLISWFRRTFVFLIWLASVALIICGILGASGCQVWGMDICLLIGVAILLFTYAPSGLLCLFGWAFRKIFKVDEKLKTALKENGYNPAQEV